MNTDVYVKVFWRKNRSKASTQPPSAVSIRRRISRNKDDGETLFIYLFNALCDDTKIIQRGIDREGGGKAVLILMIEEHLSIHFFAPSQWLLMTRLFISLTRANFSPDTTQSSQKTRHDT